MGRREDVHAKKRAKNLGTSFMETNPKKPPPPILPLPNAVEQQRDQLYQKLQSPFNKLLAIWIIFLLVGTAFYRFNNDLSPGKAFYMAVNIGYSVGWGDIPEDQVSSQWFSAFYVVAGASVVGLALGVFAEGVLGDRDDWYAKEKELQKMHREAAQRRWWMRWYMYIVYHDAQFWNVLAWLVFVAIGTVFGMCLHEEWTFREGLYFATSTLSTGGHYSIPPSTDWAYALIGAYGAVGIPLMAKAMGSLASLLVDTGDLEGMRSLLREPVAPEEIEAMREIGLEDKDGVMDKSEWVILCMIRLGTDPGLIKEALAHYETFDKNGMRVLATHAPRPRITP